MKKLFIPLCVLFLSCQKDNTSLKNAIKIINDDTYNILASTRYYIENGLELSDTSEIDNLTYIYSASGIILNSENNTSLRMNSLRSLFLTRCIHFVGKSDSWVEKIDTTLSGDELTLNIAIHRLKFFFYASRYIEQRRSFTFRKMKVATFKKNANTSDVYLVPYLNLSKTEVGIGLDDSTSTELITDTSKIVARYNGFYYTLVNKDHRKYKYVLKLKRINGSFDYFNFSLPE